MFETTNQTGKSNQNSAMALDHLANPPTLCHQTWH